MDAYQDLLPSLYISQEIIIGEHWQQRVTTQKSHATDYWSRVDHRPPKTRCLKVVYTYRKQQ
jgi:hypothetical protein